MSTASQMFAIGRAAVVGVIHYPHLFMVVWLAAFILAERLFRAYPIRTDRASANRTRRPTNVLFGLIHHSLLSPFLTLPLLAWAASLRLWDWPGHVPTVFSVLISAVVLDITGYWFHRASHGIPFLWRFHQIHHLDEEMDVTSGLRVHFGERLMQGMVTAVVIAAVGLPLLGVAVHALAGYAFATFHHSNVRLPQWLERVLAPVIITPEVHFPHHHELKRDTNSNFGFIFPWWDKLFGTFNHRRRTPAWRMGLDYSPDLACIALLREPFQPTPLWVRRADASPGRDVSPRGSAETPNPELEQCRPQSHA